jgi:hypothetical protein
MSRVTLGASLFVAIICLTFLNIASALEGESNTSATGVADNGEPEASATEGGYGGEYGVQSEGYGGRGGYGLAASQAEDLFGAPGTKAARENVAAPNVNEPAPDTRQATSAAAHIEAALIRPLKSPLQYEDQPLNEVITVLAEEYDIPILFDNAALESVAISPESEISINLRNITLRSALNLMLRQPGLEELTFIIDDEVLLITTKEKANERMTVEVYRVDDLTRGIQQSFGGDKNPYSSLVEVVTHCVAFDTWMVNGSGEGEVRLMQPGILVVSQTHRVHEQVQQLLEKLRTVRAEVDEDDNYGRGRGGRGGGRF